MNKSIKWRRKIVAVILVLVPLAVSFVGPPVLLAQSAERSGTLIGVITGTGGDVLTGAVVQLRNSVTRGVIKSRPADDMGLYIVRKIPFGTYDLAVETEDGFYLTSDQVVVKDATPQTLSISVTADKQAAAALASTSFWSGPVGIALLTVGVVGAGFVIADQFGNENSPESPLNP